VEEEAFWREELVGVWEGETWEGNSVGVGTVEEGSGGWGSVTIWGDTFAEGEDICVGTGCDDVIVASFCKTLRGVRIGGVFDTDAEATVAGSEKGKEFLSKVTCLEMYSLFVFIFRQ
jgi:hypothetical protein